MSDQAQTAQAVLESILRDEQPRGYLVIGDPSPLNPAPEVEGERLAEPHWLAVAESATALPSLGRQDLVLLSGLEELSRAEGEILLSRLRDLYARRVLARVIPDGTWQNNDMTAFGFTRLADLGGDHGLLYGFDVGTYKTTPDWLNPRYWANPELWGKYRW